MTLYSELDVMSRCLTAVLMSVSSLQGTCGGVLRGTGKQKIGAVLNAIGYYGLGFPIGVSLMFAAKLGIIGMCLIP